MNNPREDFGGAEEDRTPDPLRARQVLSQLSYDPQSEPPIILLAWPISRDLLCSTAHIPLYAALRCSPISAD